MEPVEGKNQAVEEEPTPSGNNEGPESLDKTGDFEELENKYKVLQGKYNAEVPRLIERTKFLEGLLANMNTSKQEAREEPEENLLNDPNIEELRKEYPTIYEGVMKLVSSVQSKTEKQLSNKIESSEAKALEERIRQFEMLMDARVKNWRVLNNDPDFLQWLSVRDKYSPYTRHQLLMEAHRNFDLETVAGFFEGFMEETRKPKLKETYVAPGTSRRSSPSGGQSGGEYLKKSDIIRFYNNVATGKVKLTPQEMKAEEARIEKALLEGRIVDDG